MEPVFYKNVTRWQVTIEVLCHSNPQHLGECFLSSKVHSAGWDRYFKCDHSTFLSWAGLLSESTSFLYPQKPNVPALGKDPELPDLCSTKQSFQVIICLLLELWFLSSVSLDYSGFKDMLHRLICIIIQLPKMKAVGHIKDTDRQRGIWPCLLLVMWPE